MSMTKDELMGALDITLMRCISTGEDVELCQQEVEIRKTLPSADARYVAGRIVKHLWIIFVLLPFVFLIVGVVVREILK